MNAPPEPTSSLIFSSSCCSNPSSTSSRTLPTGRKPPDPARAMAPSPPARRNSSPSYHSTAHDRMSQAMCRKAASTPARATKTTKISMHGLPILAPMGFRRDDEILRVGLLRLAIARQDLGTAAQGVPERIIEIDVLDLPVIGFLRIVEPPLRRPSQRLLVPDEAAGEHAIGAHRLRQRTELFRLHGGEIACGVSRLGQIGLARQRDRHADLPRRRGERFPLIPAKRAVTRQDTG